MSILGRYTKQSAERESYTIEYADDLTAGDEIVSAAVTVTPANELTINGVNQSGTSVRVWLADGVAGTKYKLEVTANTGDGRVLQDEFMVTIKDY